MTSEMKKTIGKRLTTPSWSGVCINSVFALFWALDFWLTGQLWTLGITAAFVLSVAIESVLTVRNHKKGNEEND